MPKKVLFVITKSVWGGAQKYVYDLATSLPTTGFQTVVAAGGSGPLLEKLESAGIRTTKIKFLERNVSLIKEILSLISLFKILKREQPDIVHLNSSKIGALGAIAAATHKLQTKNHRLKTIFTVHGWAFNEDRNFLAKMLIFVSQWLTSFLCDRVIVISRHDYRQALKIPLLKQEKFALITIGVDIRPEYFLRKEEARKMLSKMIGEDIKKNDLVVGAIAELTRNKGLSYLVESIKDLKVTLPNLKCIIIGDGDERAAIRNQIGLLGLEKDVHLVGFLPEAGKYIRSFDIFALPSLKEGLPYVILETMAAGLPVVATSVGGVPDLIDHERTGLLVGAKNQAAFAEAIEKALSQKNSKNTKKTYDDKLQKNFSLAKMVLNTLKLYES